MQVDWLQKNLKKLVDQTTRVSLVQNLLTTKEIPASVGAQLLDINRTSIYIKVYLYRMKNWNAKRLLIIFIQTILLGVQGKCQYNLKIEVIK